MTDSTNESGTNLTRRGLLQTTAAFGFAGALGAALTPRLAAAETPVNGGKLLVGVKGGSTADTLDPLKIQSQVGAYVTRQYANWLIVRSPNGKLEGEIAESWEPFENGKRWIFNLRKGIKFHNGKELTSADVLYTLNRHRDPALHSPTLPLMKGIADITADGPYKISIYLHAPDVGLPYLLTYFHLPIQPIDGDPEKGVGTGPFVLNRIEPGKRYTLSRNQDYFKPDSISLSELEVLVINDDAARVSALMSGGVHVITDVTPSLVPQLKNASNLSIVSSADSKFYYFGMLIDVPPFDNPDLRLALKYAVDREMMMKGIAAGYAEIGNDHPINSIFPLFSNDIPQRSHDIEKAKEHYRKSGHSGPITLHAAEIFPGAVDLSVMFQRNAADAGIAIDLKRVPVDGYWDNVYLKVPFCVSYWGALTTEDQALTVPFASDAPWNDTHWRKPDFDQLLARGRAEFDETARKSLYRDACSMLHDDGGHITVMFPHSLEAVSTKVKGYIGFPFGENARNAERCWLET